MRDCHRNLLDQAAEQHGIVTRRQAFAAGLTVSAFDRLLRNGLFVQVSAGVFRVRGAVQSPRMAISAAALATGGRSSHTTAMFVLRLSDAKVISPLHMTVDVDHRNPRVRSVAVAFDDYSRCNVRIHRYVDRNEPVIVVDGIPTVDAARTLIDMALTMSAVQLEDAFEQARKYGMLSIESLAKRFAQLGGRGRPGSAKIRALLANTAPGTLESKLEVRAWRMLRRARFSMGLPTRQLWVQARDGQRYRLDFAWPDRRVAFETEGFRWHGTNARWKQDRLRTAALEGLGWRVVIATWDDVVSRAAATLERLHLALDERKAA